MIALYAVSGLSQWATFKLGVAVGAVQGETVPKTLEMEGLFPLPLRSVWKLLWHHMDEDRIREIHPWILSGRLVSEGERVAYDGLVFPRQKTAAREVKLAGRRSPTTWRYEIEPPHRFGYEIVFDNGSVARLDNAYASAPGGTIVKSTAEVSLKGIPDFLAAWAVGHTLNRADREDLAFARGKGL